MGPPPGIERLGIETAAAEVDGAHLPIRTDAVEGIGVENDKVGDRARADAAKRRLAETIGSTRRCGPEHVTERHACLGEQLEFTHERHAVERERAGIRPRQDGHTSADRAPRLVERTTAHRQPGGPLAVMNVISGDADRASTPATRATRRFTSRSAIGDAPLHRR
jgi:hypothetical protein